MSGVEKFEKYLEHTEGIRVSGAGEIVAGKAVVKISGSGRYVENEMLKVSGSAKVDGNLNVKLVSVAGSFKASGNVKAETVKISGAANIAGRLEAEVLRVSGLLRAGKEVKVEDAKVSGSIIFECGKFETLKISGLVRAYEIKASKIEIRTFGDSEVDSIKTDFIEVRKESPAGLAWFHLEFGPVKIIIGKKSKGVLKAKRIEALKAVLENIECNELRARIAVIGENCKIEKVYYSESLEVDEKAKVGEIVKIEEQR